MTYVYPSDQDRAEDEQLNKACQRIEALEDVATAARQLIDDIKLRYRLESENDLTCPHMRYLAEMLEKADE